MYTVRIHRIFPTLIQMRVVVVLETMTQALGLTVEVRELYRDKHQCIMEKVRVNEVQPQLQQNPTAKSRQYINIEL